jgi:dihydrofolate reductase
MAELTITTFVSLDGVMQAPGGPGEDESGNFTHGGWVIPYFDEDGGKTIAEIFMKADAFLLGRGTYDIFASWWPKITDPNDLVATKLNSLPKFVASRTRMTFPWKNSFHVSDVVKDVAEIKKRFSNEVQVHGSAGLAQILIQNDLIDEYRLFTFPVTLGTGKRLFGGGAVPRSLKLVRSRTTNTGVVINVYRPAGKLKTGAVEMVDGKESMRR